MFNNLRSLHKLIVLLICGSTLVSCFDDAEVDVSQYNTLYLSAVSFGSIPRDVHTLSSKGQDSVYQTTVAATNLYPFTIDHEKNIAYNLDSLPVGTRADKIILSAFTVTGGTAAIKQHNSEKDTILALTDTLNFSVPDSTREFHLFGADGVSRRTYRVNVRIHKQSNDSLTWRQLTLEDWKAVASENKETPDNEFAAFGLTYRVEDGKILKSSDGVTFEEDQVEDESLEHLPTANFAWIAGDSRADSKTKEIVLYGTRAYPTEEQGDTLAGKIWRRMIDTTGAYEKHNRWEYLPITEEILYPVPGLHEVCMKRYDKGFLIVGLDNHNIIRLRYSQDNGRTWKFHSILQLPKELDEKVCTSLSAVIDKDNNLWLLIDGSEVWYGRAHSVSWNVEQRTFDN